MLLRVEFISSLVAQTEASSVMCRSVEVFYNKHFITRCEISDFSLFSTKRCGHQTFLHFLTFGTGPARAVYSFFFFLCHWQCPARGVHVFYEPGVLAWKNKSLPTFWQAPSVYRAIFEKTHQGWMKTSGDTVPAASANV